MIDNSESIAATFFAAITAASSFLFDESIGVVMACAAGAYFAAYKNETQTLMQIISMVVAGVFLGTLSVKGVNWGMDLADVMHPPHQVTGIVFGFLWIHKQSRDYVTSWFKSRGNKLGERIDSAMGGDK